MTFSLKRASLFKKTQYSRRLIDGIAVPVRFHVLNPHVQATDVADETVGRKWMRTIVKIRLQQRMK
jgi:hypothetical protein